MLNGMFRSPTPAVQKGLTPTVRVQDTSLPTVPGGVPAPLATTGAHVDSESSPGPVSAVTPPSATPPGGLEPTTDQPKLHNVNNSDCGIVIDQLLPAFAFIMPNEHYHIFLTKSPFVTYDITLSSGHTEIRVASHWRFSSDVITQSATAMQVPPEYVQYPSITTAKIFYPGRAVIPNPRVLQDTPTHLLLAFQYEKTSTVLHFK